MKHAVVALVLAACSSPPQPPPAPAPPPTETAPAPPEVAPGTLSPIADSDQLVTAVVDDWSATTATMRLWKRNGPSWLPVGEPWQAVVGHAGTAWGAGMHGVGPPPDRSGPTKVEGDGKSPAGAFRLVASYGYTPAPPPSTRVSYTQMNTSWKCVDDPASRAYNKILDARTVTRDWSSAEEMKRSDALYTWVVEVAHNPARTPAAGSCIFLHVWGGEGSTTSGCTAMAEPTLARLLAALEPTVVPAYVLLPRAEYEALEERWALPPL